MLQALDNFAAASRGANFAAFYFAGHGVANRSGRGGAGNQLVPVDSDLSEESAIEILIPINKVHEAMNGAINRLTVFDNCRNSPAGGWRQQQVTDDSYYQVRNRKTDLEQHPGRMWIFSAAPGRAALDGPAGQNSPFAAVFLRQLAGESIDLRTMGNNLRRDLLIATEGQQIVQSSQFLKNAVLLKGPRDSTVRPTKTVDTSRVVELPNAYAFAKENNFPMQPALIAIRPTETSPHKQKVGAFKFTQRTSSGIVPLLIIIISVNENNIAEIMLAGEGFWRNFTGAVSGSRLEYKPRDAGAKTIFDWRDANSGSVSMTLERDNSRPHTDSFTRLDG